MDDQPAPVDFTMLRSLTGGDASMEKELMQVFVEQSDLNMKTLRENAVSEGENKAWIEAAHMLKGSSGSIGAEKLRLFCGEAQNFKGESAGRSALFARIDNEYAVVKAYLKTQGLLD